jgi:hypothetical protein
MPMFRYYIKWPPFRDEVNVTSTALSYNTQTLSYHPAAPSIHHSARS